MDDDEELHEVVTQPVKTESREKEDDGMEEEELLRQRMMQPNPLIQPNQTTPDRTYSQVTSTNDHTPDRNSIRQVSPETSPTHSVDSSETKRVYTQTPSNQPTMQPVNKLTPQQTNGPPSIVQRRLQWSDQEPVNQHRLRV